MATRYEKTGRAWYLRNKERLSAERKKKYKEDPEPQRARIKAYAENNKARVKGYQKEWRRSESGRLRIFKKQARSRGIENKLTDGEILSLLEMPCTYCGDTPAEKGSIDRVDSSGCYESENVAPACVKCNVMKNSYSVKEFYEHIHKIYEYHNSM